MSTTILPKAFEIICGSKTAYCLKDHTGKIIIRMDCAALPDAVLKITVTQEQIEAFIRPNRTYIQDIFPELPPSLREALKMGTTPGEWHEMFGGPSLMQRKALLPKAKRPTKKAYYQALGYDFTKN